MKHFIALAILATCFTHVTLHGMELTQPQTLIEKKCAQCGKPSELRCGRCQTNYCSRDCQKTDWPTHSQKCKKSVKENPATQVCTQEQEDIIMLVRNNPVKAQKRIDAVIEKEYVPACAQLMKLDIPADQLFTKLYEHMLSLEQKSPLLFIRECCTENDMPCRLSREAHPEYRSNFEKRVSTALSQKISLSPKKEVICTAFACGSMLLELRVLMATLTQHPEAQITMHCIDMRFAEYFRCHDPSEPCEVTLQTDGLSFLIHNKTRLMESLVHELDVVSKKSIINAGYKLLGIERLCKQFLGCLKKLFPLANIRLFLFETASDYLAYCEKKSVPCPDIISTVDIWDSECKDTGAQEDYANLCLQILKRNPTMNNFWLEAQNDVVRMLTLLLSPAPGAIKLPKHPMFMKIEKI